MIEFSWDKELESFVSTGHGTEYGPDKVIYNGEYSAWNYVKCCEMYYGEHFVWVGEDAPEWTPETGRWLKPYKMVDGVVTEW